ncbi:hypothetical protein B0H11DRAFT_2218602 [Mycena galericulata]|nr:hypothetical protein B0H11DRAFT_2218602 [Mycena galericulata]
MNSGVGVEWGGVGATLGDDRWDLSRWCPSTPPNVELGAWGSGVPWSDCWDPDLDGQVTEDASGWGDGGWSRNDGCSVASGGWARLMPLLWDLPLPPSRRYNAPGPLRSRINWVSHGWDERREAALLHYHTDTGGADDDCGCRPCRELRNGPGCACRQCVADRGQLVAQAVAL